MTDLPDLTELRRLALLHARAQRVPAAECARVLGRVRTADGDAPDGWAAQWTRAGDELARRGRQLAAGRRYGLARFPYPAGEFGRRAHELSVRSFDAWRTTGPGRRAGIGRHEAELPGRGTFTAWTAGLSPGGRRPLVVVMGGIVSPKEQWAPVLARAGALGVAMAVTEMPGVGENTLRYDEGSHRMLPALLDGLAGRADVTRAHALCLSFGGHLALRAAADDPRICGVATVGAPLRGFFLDGEWQSRVPATTVLTLARLTGHPPGEVLGALRGWALEDAPRVPVTYVAAARDDIVPPDEARVLGPGAEVITVDDEHGAPAHLGYTRAVLLRSALRALGVGGAPRVVAGALAGLARPRVRRVRDGVTR
ncbi:hypothetical protein SRB5_17760 [Streptomyces sp. RB5]|uniref:Alpha/beta hydrolase n=1 Tax=Streptomyces smaragdinus TaxID=2585196 RepID=A0A7K0CDW1_9ACTN|nr:hypothetical protein [Streptomyces smaragdinus]MQY11657.1 hypothetical protein [Streptomyces smaragdinus]